jgi:hypothetical protein
VKSENSTNERERKRTFNAFFLSHYVEMHSLFRAAQFARNAAVESSRRKERQKEK